MSYIKVRSVIKVSRSLPGFQSCFGYVKKSLVTLALAVMVLGTVGLYY